MKQGYVMASLFLAALMSQLNPKDLPTENRFRGMAIGGYNPMFIPRRGKLKGYQRENRRYSFNKNK